MLSNILRLKNYPSGSVKKLTMIDIANSGLDHGRLTINYVTLRVTGKSLERAAE